MKNLDEIIVESLKLINYNRNKTLTEQGSSYLPQPSQATMFPQFDTKIKGLYDDEFGNPGYPQKTPISGLDYFYATENDLIKVIEKLLKEESTPPSDQYYTYEGVEYKRSIYGGWFYWDPGYKKWNNIDNWSNRGITVNDRAVFDGNFLEGMWTEKNPYLKPSTREKAEKTELKKTTSQTIQAAREFALMAAIKDTEAKQASARKKITSSYNKQEENPVDYLLTLPSLETNNSIFIYPVANAKKSEYNYGMYYYKISNIKKLSSFDKPMAEKFFGRQCKKLSGTHPKYNVGYEAKFDWYINKNTASKCYPIVITQKEVEVEETKGDKTYSKQYTERYFNVPTTTVTKLKNGNEIKITKTKYDKECIPIGYDSCLKLSWEMMSLYNNTQGIFEFTIDRYENFKPLRTQTDNPFEIDPGWPRTYRAIMTEEWFPWTNTFKGYLEITEDSKNNFGSWVIQRAETSANKTGVQIVEDYLKTKNLSSGDYNCTRTDFTIWSNPWTYENYLEKSKAKNVSTQNLNYSTESNSWAKRNIFTYWNEKDYYNSTGTIGTTPLMLNNSVLDPYLNDLYGINDKKLGSDAEYDQFYSLKDVEALEKKYEDILNQKGNNLKSFLAVLSKDYNSEKNSKNKVSTSSFLKTYLQYKWDNILQSYLFQKVTSVEEDICVMPPETSTNKVWRMMIFLMTEGLKLSPPTFTTPKWKGVPYKTPELTWLNAGTTSKDLRISNIESCAKKTMSFTPGISFFGTIPLPKEINDSQLSELKIDKNRICTIEDGESKILNNNTIFFKLNNVSLEELGVSSPVDFNMFGGSIDANELINAFSNKPTDDNIDTNSEAFMKKQLAVYEQMNKEIDKFISTHLVVPSKLIKI